MWMEGIMYMETLFNDGIAANALFNNFKIHYENAMIKEMDGQAEVDPHFDWGDGMHVLLISDSALGRALGLFMYLSSKTNFESVRICQELEHVEGYLKSFTPDIIIFVGMPDKSENYKAISMVQKKNERVMAVMFDFLDEIIEMECRRHHIRYAFSSNKPLKDGLVYLRQAYMDTINIYKNAGSFSS